MTFQTNNNPFFFYPPEHIYLLFLKLEKDINNNNCVPFYFLPKVGKGATSRYSYKIRETLKGEINSIFSKYVDAKNSIIKTYKCNNTLAFLKKFTYNSFDIFYFEYNSSKIILNYFKVGQYIENEIFMHNQDIDPYNDHRYDITISNKQYKAINTHIPFCEYCKIAYAKNYGENISLSSNGPFWKDVENYLNNMNSKMEYDCHEIEDENLIIVYGAKSPELDQGF